MNNEVMAMLDARDDRMKDQLDQIGRSIGYGRAIQLLGQLWDDMLQATYPGVGRSQESSHRRTDIERIEAGLPLARKIVYFQKRGRKGQITAFVPFDFAVENVARVVSDILLYGRSAGAQAALEGVRNQALLDDRASATSAAGMGAADLYAALRGMHWNDGKLAVVHTKDLGLGVQTYSGDMLDTAIVKATTGGEA